jgi:hypothetical protein
MLQYAKEEKQRRTELRRIAPTELDAGGQVDVVYTDFKKAAFFFLSYIRGI